MINNVKTTLCSDSTRGTMDWLVLGTGILSLGIAVVATTLSASNDRQSASAIQTVQTVQQVEES